MIRCRLEHCAGYCTALRHEFGARICARELTKPVKARVLRLKIMRVVEIPKQLEIPEYAVNRLKTRLANSPTLFGIELEQHPIWFDVLF